MNTAVLMIVFAFGGEPQMIQVPTLNVGACNKLKENIVADYSERRLHAVVLAADCYSTTGG